MHAVIEGIELENDLKNVTLGISVAKNITNQERTKELDEEIDKVIEASIKRTPEQTEVITKQVRDLLRHGKYKPTGRGKPASEYLLGAAREQRFPKIHPLVDASNIVSLQTLLPISLIDLDKIQSTKLKARRGKPNESYVFNSAGQIIDLEDLLLIADENDRALANAVKDSMESKTGPEPKNVLGVIYAPSTLAKEAQIAAEMLAGLLGRFGVASKTAHGVLTV